MKPRENGFDRLANLLRRRHVGRYGETVDLSRSRLRRGAVAVEDGNRHALAREAARDFASDAATCAGDQPDPPVQGVRHVPLLAGLRPGSSGKSCSQNSVSPTVVLLAPLH